jgi:hypothetical protein
MADDDRSRNALARALMGTTPPRPGPTNALAQTMAGLLSPSQEQQYNAFMAFDPSVRQWRNAFSNRYGEQPTTEGGDYDYRAAWLAGSRPQPVPGDTVPHWSSVGKAPNHPTMWKQDFMTQFNVDPDTPGMSYTPEMQQFIQRRLQDSWGTLAPRMPPGGLL